MNETVKYVSGQQCRVKGGSGIQGIAVLGISADLAGNKRLEDPTESGQTDCAV